MVFLFIIYGIVSLAIVLVIRKRFVLKPTLRKRVLLVVAMLSMVYFFYCLTEFLSTDNLEFSEKRSYIANLSVGILTSLGAIISIIELSKKEKKECDELHKDENDK